MAHICKLVIKNGRPEFEKQDSDIHGKLEPKDGKTYQVYLRTDNPDISSLQTELRLVRNALEEYNRRLPYNFNVFTTLPYPLTLSGVDATIDWIEPDGYMTGSVLAWGGYPNGSLRGQMKLNNKYPWLDGFNKTGAELRAIGIILPNMEDTKSYQTYNVRQTVKHEFGHLLGLDHDTDEGSVMGAIYDVLRIMLKASSLQTLDNKYGLRSLTSRWLDYIIRSIKRKVF